MSEPAPPADGAGLGTRLQTWVGFGLVLLLTLLLCVWAAFLVPLRVGTVRLPVSLVIAGVGNVLLGRAGGRLLGVAGVLLPAVLWITVGILLGSRREEGDLVVLGDAVGTLFLAVGALGFVVAYGMTSARRAGATPVEPAGR